MQQQEILHDLVSKWVSLALEYATSAPDLRAIYVYGSSERPGSTFVSVRFDQAGALVFPEDVTGPRVRSDHVVAMHDIFFRDLAEAEERFAEAGVPAPTEYRVYFEPTTHKLDVQLSRELIYGETDMAASVHGFERWLGERAPKLY